MTQCHDTEQEGQGQGQGPGQVQSQGSSQGQYSILPRARATTESPDLTPIPPAHA